MLAFLLKLGVVLGLGLVLVCLFRFSILCFFLFCLRLCRLFVVCCCVLGLASLVVRQEIGWEERLRNELLCVEWD